LEYFRSSLTTACRYQSAEALFVTAAQRFYDELSEEDRAVFQTLDKAEDMVTSIEQHIVQLNSHRTSRLLDACKKVDHFRKSMEPFFEVVNIFVSTQPEWAGIAWGAVRLVFQVGSRYLLMKLAHAALAVQSLHWLFRETGGHVSGVWTQPSELFYANRNHKQSHPNFVLASNTRLSFQGFILCVC
jgi:hypothetical protein